MAWLRALFSPRWRWLTITVMWLGVAVLAQLGLATVRPPMSVWDRIYKIPGLFTTGFSDDLAAQDWRIQAARFAGPLVFASTFLVATAGIFREQLGRLRLRFARGHVVVAGLGDKGWRLARSYLDAGRRVAVVDTDPANPHLMSLRRRGAMVIVGDATDPQILSDLGTPRAADLIAVTGTDAGNTAVLAAARDLPRSASAPRLGVAVHLTDPRLARLLRARELAGEAAGIGSEFFNIHQRGVRLWLTEVDPFRPDPQGRPPHLVVAGLSEVGASVVVQAAHRWHTQSSTTDGGGFTVTVVDPQASAWARALSLEHPRFGSWARVHTQDLDPTQPGGEAIDQLRAVLAGGSVTDVFVTLDDESAALTTALMIRHALGGNRATVHVQTRSERGLATLVTDADDASHPVPIVPYGVIDRTCTAAAISGGTNEQVAMAIHDDYLERARAEGRTGVAVRPWEELTEQDREANREAASSLVTALRSVGYLLIPALGWDEDGFRFGDDEVEVLAAVEHDRWLASRQAEGWRYGPERDDARKLNPALVPWEETSQGDRGFNRRFVRSVPGMLARSGFELVRIDEP